MNKNYLAEQVAARRSVTVYYHPVSLSIIYSIFITGL